MATGSVGENAIGGIRWPIPENFPIGAKNLAKVSYASRVIANFVSNFVTMATGVGRGKMWLAAFDGPFPKTRKVQEPKKYSRFRIGGVYISPIWGAKAPGRIEPKFLLVLGVHDVITPFKLGDDRFSGFWLAEGQILPFLIDFEGRSYNTHTTVWGVIFISVVLNDSQLYAYWLVRMGYHYCLPRSVASALC